MSEIKRIKRGKSLTLAGKTKNENENIKIGKKMRA